MKRKFFEHHLLDLISSNDRTRNTYRTNNAFNVSRHEIYDGRRTFFVSSPQIKKQRPKELDLDAFIAGLMINGRLERIR